VEREGMKITPDCKLVGHALLVGGPDPGVVRWSGWAPIYEAPDGQRAAKFPPMTSIRHARRAHDKWLWLRIVKGSFRAL
jgi:hypothetical protein